MAAKAKSKSSSKKSTSSSNKGDSRKLFDKQAGRVDVNTNLAYLPEGSPGIGTYAKVTKGEHQGKYGIVRSVVSVDKNGWPDEVVFRTRDANSERLVVKYDALEQSEPGLR